MARNGVNVQTYLDARTLVGLLRRLEDMGQRPKTLSALLRTICEACSPEELRPTTITDAVDFLIERGHDVAKQLGGRKSMLRLDLLEESQSDREQSKGERGRELADLFSRPPADGDASAGN